MIKQIVQHSAKLIEFIVLLQLNLSKPQYRHVLNIADTVIVCESPHKTLTALYDLLVDAPHPSNAADCLRISPWQAVDLREPLREFTISDLMQLAGLLEGEALWVSIDDSLTVVDYVDDLTISGTLAYLADSSNGLQIVDISDPMNPSEVVSASVGYINEVEVLNGYAYAFSANKVHIIDVSNPGSPNEIISQTVTTNYIENTLLVDSKLYLTEEGGGMRVLDLTNPIAPIEVFATELPGYTWDVAVDNGTAYVADGNAGFYIFGKLINFTDYIYLPAVLRGD